MAWNTGKEHGERGDVTGARRIGTRRRISTRNDGSWRAEEKVRSLLTRNAVYRLMLANRRNGGFALIAGLMPSGASDTGNHLILAGESSFYFRLF